MFLHRNGHGSAYNHGVPQKLEKWFEHFLEGVEKNGITSGPQVEVELPDGTLMTQNQWPNESTAPQRLFLSTNASLTKTAAANDQVTIIDSGKTVKMETLVKDPEKTDAARVVFLTAPLVKRTVLSGTSKVS